MSFPGVVILRDLRALFNSYMEKGLSVMDSIWMASWRAEERSSCRSLSSCWILSGGVWDAARVAKCFASVSASSLGFLVVTCLVEPQSLLISDHNRLVFMVESFSHQSSQALVLSLWSSHLAIFWMALSSCLDSSVLSRLKALVAILNCRVYILPSGGM